MRPKTTEDLRDVVSFIADLRGIRQAMPWSISKLIDRLYEDDVEVSPDGLRKILAAFLALPEDVRSNLLAGWKMPLTGWSRPQQLNLLEGDIIRPFLTLRIDRHDSQIDAAQCVEFAGCWDSPVRVAIETGTTRERAIEALRLMLATLESQWETLIGVGEIGVTLNKNKSGTPQTSDAVPPVSKSSEAKALTTAA